MTRKPKVTWLILGPDPFLAHCERCGKMADKPKMPLSIPAFVAYSDYVTALHAECKPVEVAQ